MYVCIHVETLTFAKDIKNVADNILTLTATETATLTALTNSAKVKRERERASKVQSKQQ